MRSLPFALLVPLFGLSAAPLLEAQSLQPRRIPAKPLATPPRADALPGQFVLKLVDDARVRAESGVFRASGAGAAVAELNALLAAFPGARVERMHTLSDAQLAQLRDDGQRRSGRALPDLTQYFRIAAPPDVDAAALLARLLALASVEHAYAQRRYAATGDITPPATPSFVAQQGYRGAAPRGVDADFAKAQGRTGSGTAVCDIESAWQLDHEDLQQKASQTPPVPIGTPNWIDFLGQGTNHGTASIGEIAADDDAHGVTGLATGAQLRVLGGQLASETQPNIPSRILEAVAELRRGDVILIELETAAGEPVEILQGEFDAIQCATSLGFHVVEPAGNGAIFLDTLTANGLPTDPLIFQMAVRDSGAVMVGAGQSPVSAYSGSASCFGWSDVPAHLPRASTCFGERVCAYGWGENVATLGFGSLFNGGNDVKQRYTATFDGTSSASPMLASALAVLGGDHLAAYSSPYRTAPARMLLRTTGTLSTLGTGASSGALWQHDSQIGHLPDLRDQLGILAMGPQPGHVMTGALIGFCQGSLFGVACGSAAGMQLGSAVCDAGDMNGDGRADFLVGLPGYSLRDGSAQAYSGLTGELLFTYMNPNFNAGTSTSFGRALAGIDMDADGLSDALIGDADNDTVAVAFSGTYVSQPSPSTLDYQQFIDAQGITPGFGHTLARCGDIDADGFEDVLIGAYETGQRNLAAALLSTVGNTTLVATSSQFVAGHTIAPVGDWNANGFVDVAFGGGVPESFGNGNGYGDVVVLELNGGNWTKIASLQGAAGDEFGEAIAGIGDANGDGYDDVVVGAPLAAGAGRVDLFRGNAAAAAVESVDASWLGSSAGERFGAALAGGGGGGGVSADVDGDTLPDFAIGAPLAGANDPGRVTLVSGRTNLVLYSIDGQSDGDTFGRALALAPDQDLDGRAEILVGAPGFDKPDFDCGTWQPGATLDEVGRAYVFYGHNGPVVNYGCSKLGSNGKAPLLGGSGDATPGHVLLLTLQDAPPSVPINVVVSLAYGPLPFMGTCLVPVPGPGFTTLFLGNTDASGAWSLPVSAVFAYALPFDVYMQAFLPDPSASYGYAISNGVRIHIESNQR